MVNLVVDTQAPEGPAPRHTFLYIFVALVLLAGGGIAYYLLVVHKGPTPPSGGCKDPPCVPPREDTLKEYLGPKGNVTITACESPSDVGTLCGSPSATDFDGVCVSSPGAPECILFRSPAGSSLAVEAASAPACADACNAQRKKTDGSCDYADYGFGFCVFRPRDTAGVKSLGCKTAGSPSDWKNLSSPSWNEQDCTSPSQQMATIDRSMSGDIRVPGNWTTFPMMKDQCMAEVAWRNQSASPGAGATIGNYVEQDDGSGSCWLYTQDKPPFMAEQGKESCLRSVDDRDPEGTSTVIYDTASTPLSTAHCPPYQVVWKHGDFTKNPHLRAQQYNSETQQGGSPAPMWDNPATNPETCMEACQNAEYMDYNASPSTDWKAPYVYKALGWRPASQWIQEQSACWCYDWPDLPSDTNPRETFCSYRGSSPSSSPPPGPPIVVLTKQGPGSSELKLTPAAADPDTACHDMIDDIAGICSDGHNCYEGYRPLTVAHPNDPLSAECFCISNHNIDTARLPMWEKALTQGTPSDPGSGRCAGNATIHAESDQVSGDPQFLCVNQAQYPAPAGGNKVVLGGPCIQDTDCDSSPSSPAGNCSHGYYWDYNRQKWVRKDVDSTLGSNWDQPGVCVPWA
jgi:hypothetical protein